jgi:hypothetical protein
VPEQGRQLSPAERQELLQLVTDRFPEKRVLAMSAREGEGFDALFAALHAPRATLFQPMDVDYDVYAEGEAELGWLNCQVRITTDSGATFALDELVVELVDQLRQILAREQAEPAHLKIYAESGSDAAVANLVGSEAEAELSLASEIRSSAAHVVINARVAGAPEMLERAVREGVRQVAERQGWQAEISAVQRFRPGRPVPTHRYGASDS